MFTERLHLRSVKCMSIVADSYILMIYTLEQYYKDNNININAKYKTIKRLHTWKVLLFWLVLHLGIYLRHYEYLNIY